MSSKCEREEIPVKENKLEIKETLIPQIMRMSWLNYVSPTYQINSVHCTTYTANQNIIGAPRMLDDFSALKISKEIKVDNFY